jgi:hypothetical protein
MSAVASFSRGRRHQASIRCERAKRASGDGSDAQPVNTRPPLNRAGPPHIASDWPTAPLSETANPALRVGRIPAPHGRPSVPVPALTNVDRMCLAAMNQCRLGFGSFPARRAYSNRHVRTAEEPPYRIHQRSRHPNRMAHRAEAGEVFPEPRQPNVTSGHSAPPVLGAPDPPTRPEGEAHRTRERPSSRPRCSSDRKESGPVAHQLDSLHRCRHLC